MHHLFALREAMKMLVHEEGVEAARQRHTTLARAVWMAFDAWAHPEGLALNVKDPFNSQPCGDRGIRAVAQAQRSCGNGWKRRLA